MSGFVALGQRNHAPSADHPSHDIYGVDVACASAPASLRLWQSIGGGHGERGGSITLALGELPGWVGDWRQHLARAGCAWAIPLLQAALVDGDHDGVLARLRAATRE